MMVRPPAPHYSVTALVPVTVKNSPTAENTSVQGSFDLEQGEERVEEPAER